MASRQLKPSIPATRSVDVLYSFMSTEIMLQAVRLKLFDKLYNVAEPVEVTKLAEDLSVNPGALEMLMNACTTLGFLVRSEKDSKVFFTNSEEGNLYFAQQSPYNLLAFCPFVEEIGIPGFKLEEPVRKGKQQLHTALKFDTSNPDDCFKTIYGTKERFYAMVYGMEVLAKTSLHIINDLKLETFQHTVDLGGCLGLHARTLKSLYPKMKVTLADLKPVIEEAKKQEENKTAGIEYADCDFFNAASLPQADLYVLGHILHDWSDENCAKILQNVYQNLNPGGSILLLEKLLSKNKHGNLLVSHTDMLLLALCGAKERTEKEYRELLDAQGFKDVKIQEDDSSPLYDAIMAYKK